MLILVGIYYRWFAPGLEGVCLKKQAIITKGRGGVPEVKGEGLMRGGWRECGGGGVMTEKGASRLLLEMWAGVLSQWEGLEVGKDIGLRRLHCCRSHHNSEEIEAWPTAES